MAQHNIPEESSATSLRELQIS